MAPVHLTVGKRESSATALPVLMYHHVGPRRSGTYPSLTVSGERFTRHVEWLVQHRYTGILPADWVAFCRRTTTLPRRPVLLTFDDAYADLMQHAFPVLLQHGLRATVFVPTEHMGGVNAWDCCSATHPGTHRVMSAPDVQYWASRGIDFAPHSCRHVDLTTLGTSDMRREVWGSAETLDRLLGTRARAFAYPFGQYDAEVLREVRKAFDIAFTSDEGVNGTSTDLHRMRRTMVLESDTALGLASRLRFGRNLWQWVRESLRPRTRLRLAWYGLRGRESTAR
jgi:peptidoglycan/xylan/chitin deacetylase (PgdA/CDA1 family)